MQKIINSTSVLITFVIVCVTKTVFDVYRQSVNLGTLGTWIVLVGLLYFVTRRVLPKQTFPHHGAFVTHKEIVLLLLLGIGSEASLWLFGSLPTHFHYDEFITAYTSYTLPLFQNINWFGAFPAAGEWVCQFPIFFHILQYPFVHIVPTVMGIRISTWPYILGTVFIIYLLTRYITKRKDLAFYAATAFVFMAPQQYIGSLGLHFHAATFFFLLSIYSFMIISDKQHPGIVFVLGVSVACSFLGYTSGYSIAPLLLALGGIRILMKPDRKLLTAYMISFVIALFLLAPWITYAVRYNNFFLQRVDQINSFTGTWIEPKNRMTVQNVATILPTRIVSAFSSFLRDQKSGVGDYFFGNMALFDLFSVMLLSAGFIHLMILAVQKKFHAFVFIITMTILFITGTILTQNPTPFHRLTIDFPFFSICIGCGIGVIQTLWNKYSKVPTTKYYISTLLLICFILVNSFRARMMVQLDMSLQNTDSLKIARDIQAYVPPDGLVQIIAFPQYHLGKELFFRTNGIIRYATNRMSDAASVPNLKFIIVHNPDATTAAFMKKTYPNAVLLFDSFTLKSHAVYRNK